MLLQMMRNTRLSAHTKRGINKGLKDGVWAETETGSFAVNGIMMLLAAPNSFYGVAPGMRRHPHGK